MLNQIISFVKNNKWLFVISAIIVICLEIYLVNTNVCYDLECGMGFYYPLVKFSVSQLINFILKLFPLVLIILLIIKYLVNLIRKLFSKSN